MRRPFGSRLCLHGACVVDAMAGFVPVRFSDTDHAENVALSADGLQVEIIGIESGVARSNLALLPGSGVFYFEAERLLDGGHAWGFGVGTADVPRTNYTMGATARSASSATAEQMPQRIHRTKHPEAAC